MMNNEFEDKCVEQLRSRMKDVMSNEMYEDKHTIIRFLRARNHNVDAAESMLRKHLNWRSKNKIDSLFSWYTPHEVCTKHVGLNPIGFDKEGSIVVYFDVGNLDFRGVLHSIKVSEGINYIFNRLEADLKFMKLRTKKNSSAPINWVYILDFKNFSLATTTHKPTIEVIMKVVRIYEANYPELMKAIIVINGSWYFQIAYALVKPVISGNTLKKIKIFKKDDWSDELLQYMHPEDLPAFLGGKKTDPDGDIMCRSMITFGSLVPHRYYVINKNRQFSMQPEVKKLLINRQSKKQIEFRILYPDSYLEWEFESKGGDIEVSLLYKEHMESELKEILSKQRLDTTTATETGVFKCVKAGLYYLEFDNSYSWLNQKEVYYKAKVNLPKNRKSVELTNEDFQICQ